MAPLRARYRNRTEFSPARADEPPIAATPRQTANLPPVSNAPPPEPIPVNAVEEAAQATIKERLAAQQQAEQMRSGVSQTPPFASEPQQQDDPIEQAISSLPERAKEWLRQHRDYLLDPRKNAALQHHHWQAVDEAGGQQFTDTYYEALERLLGMRAPPASRQVPLAPRQAPPGPQVSAPPTRSTQSWTSGRPVQTGPALTAEERDFAASLGISPQEYQQQKKRMYELKPELRPRS